MKKPKDLTWKPSIPPDLSVTFATGPITDQPPSWSAQVMPSTTSPPITVDSIHAALASVPPPPEDRDFFSDDGMIQASLRDGKIFMSRQWLAKLKLLCATEGKAPATKAEATPFGGLEVIHDYKLPRRPTYKEAKRELARHQPR